MIRRLIILLLIVGCGTEPEEPVDNSIREYVKDIPTPNIRTSCILQS